MTISNLIERGNPEDMDQDIEDGMPVSAPKAPKGSKNGGSGVLSRNTVVIGILVLTSSASFGLGMLAGQGVGATSNGLVVGSVPTVQSSTATLSASALGSTGSASNTGAIPAGGEVVGSNVTHSYYLPWCSQASTISNANKVWFATEQMAKSAGYTAGKGCAGL